MTASVAACETEGFAERILAGQAAARVAGKCWGGSQEGRRLKVAPEQVVSIHRLSKDGDGKAAIARARD